MSSTLWEKYENYTARRIRKSLTIGMQSRAMPFCDLHFKTASPTNPMPLPSSIIGDPSCDNVTPAEVSWA